jgi:hypothetical protein
MEAKGMPDAISNLLSPAAMSHRREEPLQASRLPQQLPLKRTPIPLHAKPASRNKLWSRLEQGLRVADLLLHSGGFSCIVLDLGSLRAEYASRVPLATWFRFRAAAERSQSNVLLLTQHTCAKTSAGLVLRLAEASISGDRESVCAGLQHRAELARQRFVPNHVLPLRKPPQSTPFAEWQANTVWGGPR